MPALTTTQTFYDEHNMVQGSLSFLTITLLDDDHKFWPGTVTAAANGTNLKKGIEYTVDVPGTGSAADWASVGFHATDQNRAARAPVAGEKFVADDGLAATALGADMNFFTAKFPGATVSYGSESQGLQEIVQNISSRASIVYIGLANSNATGAAGLNKVRIIIENAGYQNDEGMDHDRMGEDSTDYTSAHAATLLKYLNRANGLADTDTTKFNVEKFTF